MQHNGPSKFKKEVTAPSKSSTFHSEMLISPNYHEQSALSKGPINQYQGIKFISRNQASNATRSLMGRSRVYDILRKRSVVNRSKLETKDYSKDAVSVGPRRKSYTTDKIKRKMSIIRFDFQMLLVPVAVNIKRKFLVQKSQFYRIRLKVSILLQRIPVFLLRLQLDAQVSCMAEA